MSERDFEIIGEGISVLSEIRSSSQEKYLNQINELARALSEEAGEEEIFFRDGSFREKYFSVLENGEVNCAPFNLRYLKSYRSTLSLLDRGILCRRLCDILGIKGIMSASTFFDEGGEGDGSICYVRSPYADTAYLRFAEVVEEPRALYGEDFTQVCESVYYGRSTYCILPISNSNDGRLGGFRNLVIKYSLMTVCTVSISSGDSETLFALMKRELEIPKTADGAMLEFRIPGGSGLNDLLTVARVCGMDALAVSFSPDVKNGCDIVLTVSDEGICGFLAYLSIEHPDFTPVGIYKKI